MNSAQKTQVCHAKKKEKKKGTAANDVDNCQAVACAPFKISVLYAWGWGVRAGGTFLCEAVAVQMSMLHAWGVGVVVERGGTYVKQ